MEMKECPICAAEMRYWERYPNQVCERCQSRTADAYGRRIKFTNAGLSGGLEAFYLDNAEEKYTRQLCYIDGRKCFAGEHHFGGIVVEVVKNYLCQKPKTKVQKPKSKTRSFR